jgi:hypothetical protein
LPILDLACHKIQMLLQLWGHATGAASAFSQAYCGFLAPGGVFGAYSGASGHSFRQHPATYSGVSGHLWRVAVRQLFSPYQV